MDEFVTLAQKAGPASGGLLIALSGAYIGQYAKLFPPAFQWWAGLIAVIALGSGVLLAILAAIPPVIRAWKPAQAPIDRDPPEPR